MNLTSILKLRMKYKLKAFQGARDYWLKETVNSANERIIPFKSYFVSKGGKVKYASDYGLINGFPGISLSLN